MDKAKFLCWLNDKDDLLFNTESFFRDSYFIFGSNKLDLAAEANLIAMKRQMLAEIKSEILAGTFL